MPFVRPGAERLPAGCATVSTAVRLFRRNRVWPVRFIGAVRQGMPRVPGGQSLPQRLPDRTLRLGAALPALTAAAISWRRRRRDDFARRPGQGAGNAACHLALVHH